MKTKIIVLLAVIACKQLVWGQMDINNPIPRGIQLIPRAGQQVGTFPIASTSSIEQEVLAYFKGLTNLTKIESDAINRIFANYDMGTPRRLLPDDQPENYQRMTEAQKTIFTILFYSAKEIAGNIGRENQIMSEHLNEGMPRLPHDAWRKLNEKPVFVLSAGFEECCGTVIQSFAGSVLVKAPFDISGDFFIKNFPLQVSDGQTIDVYAKKDGLKTFRTVLGATRTVTQFDYCESCDRPADGGKIEDAYLAPILARIKSSNDEIKSRIAENNAVADTAKKRVAGFAQQIEDDKIMAAVKKKQNQEMIKDATKAKVLKHYQERAENGDAIAMLRLGEMFRDGEGVAKDLKKARDYLAKAAAAGSPTAADELKKLPTNQN